MRRSILDDWFIRSGAGGGVGRLLEWGRGDSRREAPGPSDLSSLVPGERGGKIKRTVEKIKRTMSSS